LFGIGQHVASDVKARIGLFEQAMTGHDPSEPAGTHEQLLSAAKNKQRWAPLLTGGVVLLDEIGDLSESVQAKLLRVLNGEKQYRLGREGNEGYGFQYSGITILATWRDLSRLKNFRRDLWDRIQYNRIQVPGPSAYPAKGRIRIIRSIHRQSRELASNELA